MVANMAAPIGANIKEPAPLIVAPTTFFTRCLAGSLPCSASMSELVGRKYLQVSVMISTSHCDATTRRWAVHKKKFLLLQSDMNASSHLLLEKLRIWNWEFSLLNVVLLTLKM